MGAAPDTFDGDTFERDADGKRLGKQLLAVRALMIDGVWRTLDDISCATGFPQASVSARLRDLRKPRFGRYDVERRRKTAATFEYRLSSQRPVLRCPKCGAWVAGATGVLRSHLREHYPNGCGYCSHPEQKVEIEDGERTWTCKTCGKVERSQQQLFG